MRARTTILILPILILSASAADATDGAFTGLASDYEAIRLALVGDSTDAVQEHAASIAASARELAEAFDVAAADVAEGEADTAKALLTEIAGAATRVAEAEEIATIREAYFELSKPMGRYRKLTGDTSTVVMFCPMVKKAWLQPDGEVGNPYAGQSMPTCGERIPD